MKEAFQTSTPPPIDLLKATLSGAGAFEMLIPSCWDAVLELKLLGYQDTPDFSTTKRRLFAPATDVAATVDDCCWWWVINGNLHDTLLLWDD